MTDLTWINDVDVASLSAKAQQDYQDYKTAYAMMKEAKARFENGVNAEAGLPKGKALVFNYRFGKLSMAIGQATAKASPVNGKAKPTLAEFLAEQAAR